MMGHDCSVDDGSGGTDAVGADVAADAHADADEMATCQAARQLCFDLEDLLGRDGRRGGAADGGPRPSDVAVVTSDPHHHSPLYGDLLTLVSLHPPSVIGQALTMTTVQDPVYPHYTGRYPLHLACDYCAPLDVLVLVPAPARPHSTECPRKGQVGGPARPHCLFTGYPLRPHRQGVART
jgi:hypothetical protein